MSALVLCAAGTDDPQLEHYVAAAERLGLDTVVAWPGVSGPAPGTAVRGVIAVRRAAAASAAEVARACGVPWHDPVAVRLSGHRLQLLGRLTATGIPVPRFAAVDAASGEGIERLAGVPGPWRVTGVPGGRAGVVDGVEALERLAGQWQREPSTEAVGVLVVEPVLSVPGWVLMGLLDAGALRVLGLIDAESADPQAGGWTRLRSPSALPRAAQAHLAGLVSQACASVGLRQGPIVAVACPVEGQACLVDVWPGALEAPYSDVLAIVGPSLEPVSLEELVVRHATGAVLDGYGLDGQPRTRRFET